MLRLFPSGSATFPPACVSLMMRAVTPADTDTIADCKERHCCENKEKRGVISVSVQAFWGIPALQNCKLPCGRERLSSQVLISEKRMSDPVNKLRDWDAQKLGSAPRQRKKFLQFYEIPFSALSTTTKPGCFVWGVRWDQGLALHSGK